MHDVDDFSLDLVVNQVVFEAFDGELADLGESWVGEVAKFAHSGHFGDLLKGGFGGVEESVTGIEVILANVGKDVDQILNDDSSFDELRH